MEQIGKVEAILNDQLVLIESNESLHPDEIVSVFSIIEDPKLKELGIQEPIYYPKGELKVLCGQSNNKYLAERFREINTRTRKEIVPGSFTRSLTGLIASMQPETKEITEEIPGEWSVEINKDQSLNIAISKVLSVGDLIGRLS